MGEQHDGPWMFRLEEAHGASAQISWAKTCQLPSLLSMDGKHDPNREGLYEGQQTFRTNHAQHNGPTHWADATLMITPLVPSMEPCEEGRSDVFYR